MPRDPESLGEVARMISDLTASMERRFDSIERRLDGQVSSQVFEITQHGVDRRIADLAAAINNERESRVAADAEERTAREKALTVESAEREKADNRAGVWVRSLLVGLLVPVVLWLGTLLTQSSEGGGLGGVP